MLLRLIVTLSLLFSFVITIVLYIFISVLFTIQFEYLFTISFDNFRVEKDSSTDNVRNTASEIMKVK